VSRKQAARIIDIDTSGTYSAGVPIHRFRPIAVNNNSLVSPTCSLMVDGCISLNFTMDSNRS